VSGGLVGKLFVKQMEASLFAYGTLMCPDILERVTGSRFSCSPAILRHYSRRRLRGELYPGIVQSEGEEVEGLLYQHLRAAVWPLLDRFEGEEYRRASVQVLLATRGEVVAYAYVLQPAFAGLLTDERWSFDDFLATGRQKFARQHLD